MRLKERLKYAVSSLSPGLGMQKVFDKCGCYLCCEVGREKSGSDPSLLSRVTALGEAPDTSPLILSGYPGFQATTYASRSYTGLAPGYTYQFPGKSCLVVPLLPACPQFPGQSDSSGRCLGVHGWGRRGLPAGGLEGRACLRKKHLSPPIPSPTPPQKVGTPHPGTPPPHVVLHGTVLSQADLCLHPAFSPLLRPF